MVRIDFDSKNKVSTNFDYPKLHLDHNEKARIACIEAQPEVNWVHTLRAPKIVNGQMEMESVKNKDGSFTEKPKMEFIGKHLCFGNVDKLMEADKDPQNCPTCAKAQQSDAVGVATRRFAMHVIQYKTQPGAFKIQTPFQAELVVWGFTNQRYNTLTDIAEEHGSLMQKDLLLGPCENKMFQNYDIQVGGTAEWLADDSRKAFVQSLYESNKIADLTPAFARKISREMAMDDVEKVLIRHQQAYGGGAVDPVPGGTEASAVNLEDLFKGNDAPATPEPVSEAPAAAPEPVAEAPVESPAEAPAEAEEEKPTLDFDSLLKGL